MQVGQQRFASKLFELVVHDDALESAGARNLAAPCAAYGQIALPRRNAVARVEGETCRRDGWNPQHERLLDAGAERRLRNARSFVGAPEAPLGPTVVASRLNQVDLVTAVGSVFRRQHGTRR